MSTPACPKCKLSKHVTLAATQGVQRPGAACGMIRVPPRRIVRKKYACKKCSATWWIDRPPSAAELARAEARQQQYGEPKPRKPKSSITFATA